MKTLRLLALSVLLMPLVVGRSAPFPTTEEPLEIVRVLDASFDHAWNEALPVARFTGTIVSADKSSGILCYTTPDPATKAQVYVNVYIKKRTADQKLVIYVFQRFWRMQQAVEYPRDFARQFLDSLTLSLKPRQR